MDGPEGSTSAAEEDFQRELAARRKDLERDFQDKVRDLKAQERRRMDQLARDRSEWDAHKRQQAKELADKAEKLRRPADNARKADALTAQERKEMETLRQRIKDLEQAKLDATAAVARSQERVDKARQGARSTSKAAPWLAAWAIAGGLLWLSIALGAGDGAAVRVSGGFLAVAVALAGWLAWSLRRTRA